jgi:hypothetical protein
MEMVATRKCGCHRLKMEDVATRKKRDVLQWSFFGKLSTNGKEEARDFVFGLIMVKPKSISDFLSQLIM